MLGIFVPSGRSILTLTPLQEDQVVEVIYKEQLYNIIVQYRDQQVFNGSDLQAMK